MFSPSFAIRKLRFLFDFCFKSRQLENARFACTWSDRAPCLHDKSVETGFDAHYIYHTAWATRILLKHSEMQNKHIDVSSSISFVTQLSAFMDVKFYDFRPARLTLSNLECGQADLLKLPFENSSIESLSCMHVVEHIGLERYGDPFDPEGDLKAIAELKRVLAVGGRLLFVVPVGRIARIQYNAHRIYRYDQIISYFDNFILEDFSYIDDAGNFLESANSGCTEESVYGCGCFCFKKINSDNLS